MKLIKNNLTPKLMNIGMFVSNKTKKTKPLEGLNFFPLEIIESNEIYLNKRKKVDNNVKSDLILVEKNNILYGKCRPLLDKAIIAPDNGVTTGEVLVYETNFVNFFIHLFHNKKFLNYNVSNSSGSKMPRTSNEIVKSFKFNYISQDHMLKIGDVLNKNYLKLENIKKLIRKLEVRNQFYAENLTNGSILLDNTTVMNIEKFENIIKEHKKSKVMAGDSLKVGLYPFFNCSKKQTLYSNEYLIDDSVLLLATGGAPSVNYYNGKLSYSTDVWCVNSKYAKYLYYFYNANIGKIDQCFQGGGLKHLSKKDFKKIEINIPNNDNDIQNIVDYLDKLNEEKEQIEKLLKLEEQRFEWLSDKLLSGEYIIED